LSVKVVITKDHITPALYKLLQKAGNTQPLMADMGEHMKGSIDKNFDQEGRPVKWAPLKWSTIWSWFRKRKSWRTKSGEVSKSGSAALYGRKILTDTARLRRSIGYRAFHNRVEIFTVVTYALYHEKGTRKMPARRFLLVQSQDETYLKENLRNYLLAT